jgi:glutamyl/glutaminyl-tRNA synthetase
MEKSVFETPQEVDSQKEEAKVDICEVEDKKKEVFRLGVAPTGSDNKRIGGIRTHLYNYTFAKSEKEKGIDSTIIYRVDDTGKGAKSKEKTLSDYQFFSETLGLDFDVSPYNSQEKIGQSVFQSERQDVYLKYLEVLFDKHLAFVDRESGLTLFDIQKFMTEYAEIIEFDELLKGQVRFKLEEELRQGKRFFPLMRSDGSVLYHFASVVDDGTFGVTHVVRGEDKLPVAKFQEMVRISLDLQPKKYLHAPMLLPPAGSEPKDFRFEDLIRGGILPHALVSYMISSGYGDPENIYPSLASFIKDFDYKKIRKSAGIFDIKKLKNINKKIIRDTSLEIFFDSFLLYLKKNNEHVLVERLLNDEDLQQVTSFIRRDFSETVKLLKLILEPEYENLQQGDDIAVKYILEAFQTSEDKIPSLEGSGLEKNTFFNGLRWVLVGTHSFPEIEVIFNYLVKKDLIHLRIENARCNYSRIIISGQDI